MLSHIHSPNATANDNPFVGKPNPDLGPNELSPLWLHVTMLILVKYLSMSFTMYIIPWTLLCKLVFTDEFYLGVCHHCNATPTVFGEPKPRYQKIHQIEFVHNIFLFIKWNQNKTHHQMTPQYHHSMLSMPLVRVIDSCWGGQLESSGVIDSRCGGDLNLVTGPSCGVLVK